MLYNVRVGKDRLDRESSSGPVFRFQGGLSLQPLTGRQKEIFEFIRNTTAARGYPPSVREIGEAVGLRSSSTVHGHLARLEKKGFLRRDPTKPRAIEIIRADDGDASPILSSRSKSHTMEDQVLGVPLLGRVTAGAPLLALENVEEMVFLPKEWVQGGDVFLLKVRGQSMIEAGILEDDLVIVRRQEHAENGDIVVALLEDEATVKRFFRERDRIRLQPENSKMEPIYARNVQILGRVIGLFRTYDHTRKW